MKRILGALLMAIIIISLVPLIAAANEDSRSTDKYVFTTQNDSEDSKIMENFRMTEVRERISHNKTDIRARIRERVEIQIEKLRAIKKESAFQKYTYEKAFKARSLTKEKIENAREKYQKAKERYNDAKKRYFRSRKKIKDLKEKKELCSANEKGKECDALKADTQKFLLDSTEIILSQLEELSAKVEGAEDLTVEEAEEILTDLREASEQIERIKVTIKDLENPSREIINELAKELKNTWIDVQRTLKISSGRLINSRIGHIIAQSNQLEARLELILERAAESDVDITDLEGLVNKFNKNIKNARKKYKEAVKMFKDAKDTADVDDAVKKANTATEEAHEALKEAHEKLKDVTKELRDSQASIYLEEISEEDVESELEELEIDAE